MIRATIYDTLYIYQNWTDKFTGDFEFDHSPSEITDPSLLSIDSIESTLLAHTQEEE